MRSQRPVRGLASPGPVVMARCADLIGSASLLALLGRMSPKVGYAVVVVEPPGLRRAGDEDDGFQDALLVVPTRATGDFASILVVPRGRRRAGVVDDGFQDALLVVLALAIGFLH